MGEPEAVADDLDDTVLERRIQAMVDLGRIGRGSDDIQCRSRQGRDDLEPEDDGSYTLDFNLAYHPSCVYDPRYSCPLTPAENRLPIRIEAGERLPPV